MKNINYLPESPTVSDAPNPGAKKLRTLHHPQIALVMSQVNNR